MILVGQENIQEDVRMLFYKGSKKEKQLVEFSERIHDSGQEENHPVRSEDAVLQRIKGKQWVVFSERIHDFGRAVTHDNDFNYTLFKVISWSSSVTTETRVVSSSSLQDFNNPW